MVVRTIAGALELLARERVLTLTDQAGFSSLATAITGERVSGSWWGHPKGKLVFNISSALEDHRDVLACKLAGGKATFVHKNLWAPLIRVVTDADWRKEVMRGLSPAAEKTCRAVQARGVLPIVKNALLERDKAAIERCGVLLVTQVHTESGAHQTVFRAWTHWAPKDVVRAARKLTLGDARATLAAHHLLS